MQEPTSMMLRSNALCYGPCPKPSDEVEQHLSIHANGRVWLTRYVFGTGMKYKLNRREQIKITPDAAKEIIQSINEAFHDYEPLIVCDVGSWELCITDHGGGNRKIYGALLSEKDSSVEHQLSEIIRSVLGRIDLYVFDGQTERTENERS